MADSSPSYYPPVGFHFSVTIPVSGSQADTLFQSVSGLSAELGIEQVNEGGENRFSYRLPGRAKYGNLVLKRGLLTDSKVIDWIKDALENHLFNPADVNVRLLNEAHKPLMEWSFLKAWPVKWTVSDFNVQENVIVVETIELAYTYFRKVTNNGDKDS
jgi:phage tail-like protein